MPAPRGSRALGFRSALRTRPRALSAATMLAATLALGGGVAVSLADTTSVYFDSNRNVGAGPNPFNNIAPSGTDNVVLGHTMMPALTTGSFNLASGSGALASNTTGNLNIASGFDALLSNTTGVANVASGTNALRSNTTGHDNIASGSSALRGNTTGSFNLASGSSALSNNTTGHDNVASGSSALDNNTTGNNNLASGSLALAHNTTGSNNLASGTNALSQNTTGNSNLASGFEALRNNTIGNRNLASGTIALRNNTTGSSNLALGFGAGANLTSGSNNVDVANRGVAGESGTIRIGTKGKQNAAFLAGVSGASIAGPTQAVVVNANGRLGTATASSARLKRDVRPLGAATRRVLALRPVSYRYKRPQAPGQDRLQYGLVAEQVARQLPALVQREPKGRPAGVYYEQLSTLLLAELKRQHRELRRQGRELRRLRAQVLGRR